MGLGDVPLPADLPGAFQAQGSCPQQVWKSHGLLEAQWGGVGATAVETEAPVGQERE